MSRNLIVGIVVVVLLGALGYWLASVSHWEEVEVPGTLQGEALTNPFYSLQRLSESLGAHTRLRHEIMSMPPPGSIIVLDFWNWEMIPERRRRLEQWVNAGGRLVANFAQLNDTGFQEWSGIKLLAGSSDSRRVRRPAPAQGNHCGEFERLLTTSSEPHEQYDVFGFSAAGVTTTRTNTWRLRDEDGATQALRIPIGHGSVTLLSAFIPPNQGVLCGDYGLLFAAATQLHRGDTVTFLTEGHGGSLLGLIWQYGAPVVALAGVWLALWLWRSGVRFGPLVAPTESARRSLAEQIRGTGQFTLRFGGGAALYAATVRALNEVACRHIIHYERLSASDRISALEKATRLSAADLTRALQDHDARSRKEIRTTIAFLEAARRRLVAATR